ncbi:2-aminoethylphosphonate:pyruvate aminotransferase [hydrothermal vent metagenome]|uniref:2-aminoethylphosphonate--pyruvate transaminase n=1 Tax=hydrothermal vent metagenome TaxID=652676 RepID=A0A3B0THD2_9ZZZZ
MAAEQQAPKARTTALPAPAMGEPYLLTPGPLTTSVAVKRAMDRDWGSWDSDFRMMTAEMRRRLLELVEDTAGEFDCVPMQGSGTFAVEAMVGSFVPRAGKALVLINGAYGTRIARILEYLGRDFTVIDKGDYLPPRGAEVTRALAADSQISHVIAVHCETSSGILNPIAEIAGAVHAAGAKLLIDAMSSFGALNLTVKSIRFDAMVSSANKCLEGVPGFGFVIARKSELETARGRSHSLSLDIHDQWQTMNTTGQWRFTPPTHVVAAFMEALRAHEAEGGVAGRGRRYAENRDVLVAGMRQLGFETLLEKRWLSPIIVTFFSPAHPGFEFARFYELMKQKGFIIYPGKLTVVDSFRIGCIGAIDAAVMACVVKAAGEALAEMGVESAAPPPEALNARAELMD